jgi:FtsZ-binding cell division protein ZapB
MGELKNRAESLERQIVLIARELNEQKDKVAALAGEIKYIAENAERLEKENEQLQKQLKQS